MALQTPAEVSSVAAVASCLELQMRTKRSRGTPACRAFLLLSFFPCVVRPSAWGDEGLLLAAVLGRLRDIPAVDPVTGLLDGAGEVPLVVVLSWPVDPNSLSECVSVFIGAALES